MNIGINFLEHNDVEFIVLHWAYPVLPRKGDIFHADLLGDKIPYPQIGEATVCKVKYITWELENNEPMPVLHLIVT